MAERVLTPAEKAAKERVLTPAEKAAEEKKKAAERKAVAALNELKDVVPEDVSSADRFLSEVREAAGSSSARISSVVAAAPEALRTRPQAVRYILRKSLCDQAEQTRKLDAIWIGLFLRALPEDLRLHVEVVKDALTVDWHAIVEFVHESLLPTPTSPPLPKGSVPPKLTHINIFGANLDLAKVAEKTKRQAPKEFAEHEAEIKLLEVQKAVQKAIEDIPEVHEEFQSFSEIVRGKIWPVMEIACSADWQNVLHVPESSQYYEQALVKAVAAPRAKDPKRTGNKAFEEASKRPLRGQECKDMLEVIRKVVEVDGGDLRHASERLREHPGVVAAALRSNWYALEFVSKSLLQEPTITEADEGQPEDDEQAEEKVQRETTLLQKAEKRQLSFSNNGDVHKAVMVALGSLVKKPTSFESASDFLRGNCWMVIETACTSSWENAENVPEDSQYYEKALLKAVAVDPKRKGLSDVNDALARAVEGPLRGQEVKDMKKVVLKAVKTNGLAVQHASARLQGDAQVMTAAVRRDGLALKYASISLRKDAKVVNAAIKQNAAALQYVSPDSEKYDEFAVNAVKKDPCALEHVAPEKPVAYKKAALEAVVRKKWSERKDDGTEEVKWGPQLWRNLGEVDENNACYREVVLAAVEKAGDEASQILEMLLKDAKKGQISKSLTCDAQVVMEAVKSNGLAIEFASTRLQDEDEVAEAAVGQNGSAIAFVSTRLKEKREFVIKAVSKAGHTLEFLSTFKSDEEVVMSAVKSDGLALQYADEDLQKCKKVAIAAVQQNPDGLKFVRFVPVKQVATAAVQQDLTKQSVSGFMDSSSCVEVLLAALGTTKENIHALQHVPTEALKTRKVGMALISQNVDNLQYVPDTNGAYDEVVLEAVRIDGLALRHLPQALLKEIAQVLKDTMARTILDTVTRTLESTPLMTWYEGCQTKVHVVDEEAIDLSAGAMPHEKPAPNQEGHLQRSSWRQRMTKQEKRKWFVKVVQIAGQKGYEKLPEQLQDYNDLKEGLGIKLSFWDVFFPCLDYFSDILSAVSFYRAGRFQFLSAVLVGIGINFLGSLVYMFHVVEMKSPYHVVLNFVFVLVSMGLVAILFDAGQCYQQGRKTQFTKWLKLLESIESASSFTVNVYAVLLSGALAGYPSLDGKEALTKYFSVSTSMGTLPMAVANMVVATTLEAPSLYGDNLDWHKRALLYHIADLAILLCLLLVQLEYRPFGIFITGFVYAFFQGVWLVIATGRRFGFSLLGVTAALIGALITSPLTVTFSLYEAPVYIASAWIKFRGVDTVNPLPELPWYQLAFLRSTAIWLFAIGAGVHIYFDTKAKAHLMQPFILPIVTVTTCCVLVHPALTYQQYRAGRWHERRQREDFA
eukprot:TRINITY_DN8441_c0_g1_i7.p1 TRINITY_DN8441_c0_g1~~TRINITY_DN8441_c0_g1_i7.p1  ORF type:complete len:1407 (+),score=247.20 TRINITY_DN8441_c0_g1_i7:120-4223(+)